MKNRICAITVAAVWAVLAVWAWLAPSRDISVAERRQLAQKPAIQTKTLLDGSFPAAKSTWSGAKPALFARNTANKAGGQGRFGAVSFERL